MTAPAPPAATPGAGRAAGPPAWLVGPDPTLVRPQRRGLVHWLLRLATAGAFLGHGAYGAVLAKPGWYPFLAQLGVDRAAADAHALLLWTGGFEMLLGLLALVWPARALLLVLCAWKLGSEFVWYPLVGLPAWEFVERWANYTAPLALLVVRGWPRSGRDWLRWRRPGADRAALPQIEGPARAGLDPAAEARADASAAA